MTRAPWAVLSWNIPPGRAQLEAPQDPIDDTPVVCIPVTSQRITWKQGLQGLPLAVTQICSYPREPTLRPISEFSRTDPRATATAVTAAAVAVKAMAV